jgi:cytochrome P450
MCLSNIIAGADTTAVSLSSILLHLLQYPQTLQRLRAELAEFEAKGECGNPNVSFKEAQNMPYLQAVIKEALRVHPATGLPLWRVVPPQGAEICGNHFKGGDIVGANSWVMHYNEDVWGSDAATFRPERWLDEPEEKLKAMERAYMPVRWTFLNCRGNITDAFQFGLGARTCIGKNVSMLEMSKLIPQLVRRFDFELENREKPWTTANYWFVKQGDFNMRVKARNEKA